MLNHYSDEISNTLAGVKIMFSKKIVKTSSSLYINENNKVACDQLTDEPTD
jgi:hypothetical protein